MASLLSSSWSPLRKRPTLSSEDSSTSSDDDAAVAPMDLCAELPPQLKRSFDDFEALEEGSAREFIPRECLNPQLRWTECRVLRENKVNFTMVIEKGCRGPERFLLSAKRVGDAFYISQYRGFPGECDAGVEPTRRFCAVVRKQPGSGHRFVAGSASGCTSSDNDIVSQISHSWFKQKESSADIRTVDVKIPAPPKDKVEAKYVWDYQPAGGGAVATAAAASAPGGGSVTRDVSKRMLTERFGNPLDDDDEDDDEDETQGAEQISIANQIPAWDHVNRCLVMKFLRKRVKTSSSKNFVLYFSQHVGGDNRKGKPAVSVDQNFAIMQFGKVKKGQYCLDFIHPITPIQAFAIALSAFAFKV